MRKSMCLLLVLLLLTSCGIANKKTSPSPQDKQSAQAVGNKGGHEVRKLNNTTAVPLSSASPNGVNHTTKAGSEIALKDHLEQLAKRVPGVDNAHCVVMGKTAIVGLDVKGSLSRSRVGSIKYSVAEAIRKDPRSVNALVTADMDLSSRLAELSNHISKGRPVSGFASELADIVGRIIPQIPEDTKPRKQ
ncbi:YhcN/YlaJ family sporulation lipoprotein [Paenibacillus agri]|uniref:YhcN/YlaJ family sporulation lipoprotein n=1 Tax=Paenibacillus agri TaxID=2744309 RepID=A0A850ERH3_9BACL|nr:YhcN/YlaJ family sporulation lipoprotein [Paenibacillus agri]NUU62390.1 YhcN/YlaJ family sporulation lipoprotein [Paenibacillus agri]